MKKGTRKKTALQREKNEISSGKSTLFNPVSIVEKL